MYASQSLTLLGCFVRGQHLASSEGNVAIVEALISRPDINVNCTDRWSNTPLRDAVREGHLYATPGLEGSTDSAVLMHAPSASLLHLDSLRRLYAVLVQRLGSMRRRPQVSCANLPRMATSKSWR